MCELMLRSGGSSNLLLGFRASTHLELAVLLHERDEVLPVLRREGTDVAENRRGVVLAVSREPILWQSLVGRLLAHAVEVHEGGEALLRGLAEQHLRPILVVRLVSVADDLDPSAETPHELNELSGGVRRRN